MTTQAAGISDLGNRRASNEDRYLIDQSLGLYVVCDGLGGHAAGEIAAERSIAFAADYIRQHHEVIQDAVSSPDEISRVSKIVESATQQVSQRLNELSRTDVAWAGMGTTMTMLLVVGNKGIMAHVGDSRLYLLRQDQLHLLSSDHTFSNELLHAGEITKEHPLFERYNHVLTRSIGQQAAVQVETLTFDFLPGDFCLICSDGLSNYFSDDQEIMELIARDEDLHVVCNHFVDFANSSGGADNITLVIVKMLGESPQESKDGIQKKLETLKSLFLCHELSTSRLIRILNTTSLVECAANQEVFPAGATLDGLYVVLKGSLLLEDDLEAPIKLCTGDWFGETSLLEHGKVSRSVVASEPACLLLIPRDGITKLIRKYPKLGNIVLKNLCIQLGKMLTDTSFDLDTIAE